MRQVHHQKVDLALNIADDGKRSTKVSLSMTLRMQQWHKHPALRVACPVDVILNNRDTTSNAIRITKTFKYPL